MKTVKIFASISAILLLMFVSCKPNNIEKEESNLYRILVGDKYGFIDKYGKIIIEPQYDDANLYFSEGLCFVKVGDKKYIIDKNGEIKIEAADSIRYVDNFIGGLARINSTKGNGIINANGEQIISAIHYWTSIIKDGDEAYILVEGRKNLQDWFMTDMFGKIIGSKWDGIRLFGFRQGLCAVKMNGKWGYMDKQGNLVIDTIFDNVREFTEEGLAWVCKGEEEFYIDKMGNCVIRVNKALSDFSCNRAAVILNGEKCLIDKVGNKICSLDCDRFNSFGDDNLATIIKNGKASKIDTLGNVVLKTQFDYIAEFRNGVALADNNGKWGVIDLSGKAVINFKYDYHNYTGEKLFMFSNENENRKYIYDYEGNLIWQDLPKKTVSCPWWNASRENFIEYYDANISNLDPIEGIYYVTVKNYYQNRNNLNEIGLNGSRSFFYAVARYKQEDTDFTAFSIDDPDKIWVNKFVKLGESNNYAIMESDKTVDDGKNKAKKYSSEGRVTIDNPNLFEFRLEQESNGFYNFFVTYEFVRDYPTVAEYEQYQRAEWTGSGFAIADGYIATNYHVTNGAKTIRVRGINGNFEKTYKGYVVTSDKKHDLSIVKIVDAEFDSFGAIPYKVGRETVETGDDIFVLGYPMTSSMGNEVKLTDGIISSSTGFKGDESMYQISAAVQPGNSGGPLFNSEGNVVGIVCGKHADAENANYAIKVSYLFSLLDEANCNIKVADKNSLKTSKLSDKVKKIKDFVYLIECSSK